MALTRCPECKKEISTKAGACPHCGYVKPKPKQYGCGTVILISIVVGIWVSAISPNHQTTSKPPTPKTAEQLKEEKIKLAFSPWDGSHRQLEKYVKNNLKDPESYEHIETRYGVKDDIVTVVMKYRAKNSFGGFVVNQAIATAKIDGTLITVDIGD